MEQEKPNNQKTESPAPSFVLPNTETQVTNQPPIGQSPPPQPSKPKRKLGKKSIILIIVLLLAAVAAAVYFFVLIKDEPANTQQSSNNNQQSTTATPTTFAPRFNSVNAVVDFDGGKWYAATGAVIKTTNGDATAEYFSNTQGVPVGSPNSLVVHADQLWVSTLEGVAVYNKASNVFLPVKEGIASPLQNGHLYYDASAKKLYLNSFTGFYAYNDQTKKFESIAGPANAQNFAANEKYVALYSSSNPDWPIWVLNKSTGKWSKNTPAMEQQSYKVANVGGKIIVLGRSKGYISCEQAGKITATSAYFLDDSGVWQPFTAFNADKSRSELILVSNISSPGASARTQSCSGNGNEKLYSLTVNGTTLTLTNEKSTTSTGTFNNPDEEAVAVSTLIKATKLHTSISMLDVDGAGNAIFAFSDTPNSSSSSVYTGYAVANKNDLTKSTTIDTSSAKDTDIVPILCGAGKDRKLTYLFSGTQNIVTGGYEGFPDGTWKNAKLYSVDGSKITEYKDLGTDVSAPSFSCTSTDIVWLGTSGLNKMNRDTKAITKVGANVSSNILYSASTAKPTNDGGLWFGIQGTTANTSTLYYYDAAKGSYTTVASKTNVSSIAAASSTHAVVVSDIEKSQTSTVFDLAGKAVQTLPADHAPVVNTANSDEFALLQLDLAGQSIFKNFTLAKFKAGSAPVSANAQNTAYTAWYISAGDGFGLNTRPSAVYDSTHNTFWLNDDLLGVNAIKL